MGKAISCGHYVPYRDGRPRFVAGPGLRGLGFAGRDLKHDDGRWFSFEEARAWSIENDKAIAAKRSGAPAPKPKAPPRARSIEVLLLDWHASDAVQSLSPRTIEGYDRQISAIIYKPQSGADRAAGRERVKEGFAVKLLDAVGKPEVVAFIEYQKRVRGHHMALASRAVISAAFTWGESSTRWRLTANPAARLRFKRPKGRIVIYTDAEIRALRAAAAALPALVLKDGTVVTRRSIGTSTMLGLFTGQRQGDRISLSDGGLQDGRRMFRQSKTGVVVAIPETPDLRAEIEAAAAHAAAIKLRTGTRGETIVLDETTGLPYNEHTFRHVFGDVRELAIKGSNEYALAPCPSLAGKRDADLRDTAVTWLARAGCTMPEIASITGHSLASIHSIMKHYLAITPELADAAIGKLVDWMKREGMAV